MTAALPKPVVIQVTGRPVAKGRGRAAVTNKGKVIVFTPKNTRVWERDAKNLARVAMGERDPITGPVHVVVRAVFPISASWPTWKRGMAIDGTLKHTSKPDGDNVLKAAKDAMKGIVYMDDSQAVASTVEKRFGNRPMVVIAVVPIEGFSSNITKRPAE